MKKLLSLMLCAVLVSSNVFTFPVSAAGVDSDSGTVGGADIMNRCSTGVPGAVQCYYASTEVTSGQKKDLKIDIEYGIVGYGRFTDSTQWVKDFYTFLADDTFPVEYIYSTHFVGGSIGFLYSDTR